jgi:hypothetical protein
MAAAGAIVEFGSVTTALEAAVEIRMTSSPWEMDWPACS